jgi:hypothetical protein
MKGALEKQRAMARKVPPPPPGNKAAQLPPESDSDSFFLDVTAKVNDRFFRSSEGRQWVIRAFKLDSYSKKSYFLDVTDKSNPNLRMEAEIGVTEFNELAQQLGANIDQPDSFKDKGIPMTSDGPQNSIDAFISLSRAKKIDPNYQRPSVATIYNKSVLAVNSGQCPNFMNEDQFYIQRVFEGMMGRSNSDKFLAKYMPATMNKDPQADKLKKCLQSKSS